MKPSWFAALAPTCLFSISRTSFLKRARTLSGDSEETCMLACCRCGLLRCLPNSSEQTAHRSHDATDQAGNTVPCISRSALSHASRLQASRARLSMLTVLEIDPCSVALMQ